MPPNPKVGPSCQSDAKLSSVGSPAHRLICALALLPIVPAVSLIGMQLQDDYFGGLPLALDELRYIHLSFSILWVGGTILIWRQAILWTLGRKWLTALTCTIPFVQVIYAQPMWTSGGCLGSINDGFLRVGQHQVGIAVWVWVAIWIWWGWEKLQMTGDTMAKPLRVRVTPTARRLIASIATIPFAFGCFLISGQAQEEFLDVSDPTSGAFACAAVAAVLLWILIWRRAVVWSAKLIRRTIVTTLMCLALPIAAHFMFVDQVDTFFEFVLGCLPVIGWGAWMMLTVGSWPLIGSGAIEAGLGPCCLKCGYLMVGLRSTRCPECGASPTLDELWAATEGALS